MKRLRFAILALIGISPLVSLAENKVTTYITVTQEERRSSQFNLTEWLKIQARIKEMDLYLAMFSNPKKEKFQFELSLLYARQVGAAKLLGGFAGSNMPLTTTADFAQVQMWFTNIINQTFGVRTLNIDFGLEGHGFLPISPKSPVSASAAGTRGQSVDLRIFGKNIQDSSFVLKYGTYSRADYISGILNSTNQNVFTSTFAGLEMQLYAFHWLGINGSLFSYDKAKLADMTFASSHVDYGIFIEISLFRFMIGRYVEERKYHSLTNDSQVSDSGNYAALKVQF